MLSLYLSLVSARVRSQMQYRLSFVFDVLSTVIGSGIDFLAIAVIFTRFPSIAGWSLGEVAFLFGLVSTAFAIMDLMLGGFDPDQFTFHIQRGTFDQFLLRPVSVMLQVLGSEFVLRRLGRLAQGVVIFTLALHWAQPVWTIEKAMYLPVVLVSTIAYFGGLFIAGATICFWTVERIEAVNMFTYGGTELMSYPLPIYHEWIRRFFMYILPAAFLNYYPALYFLGRTDPLGLPRWASFLAPLAGFGVLGAAIAFWQVGVRKYTSTGT